MSGDYMDLVLCRINGRGNPYLCRAPEFTGLRDGDRVIVQTKNDEAEAIIIGKTTVNIISDGDFIEFAKIACDVQGMHDLPKVLQKIFFSELEYGDENEKSGSDTET